MNRIRSYFVVFAATLALNALLEPRAQATNIDADTTINTPKDFGPSDVNIATGHGSIVTLTLDAGAAVTSTGSWHVGQASDAQGNIIVNTGGSLVTEQMRLGDADAAQGTLDINGGVAVITPGPHAKTLAAVILGGANASTGVVNIHNVGELQTTGLSFGEPPQGPAPASASLTLDAGTITALEDNPDFITHSDKVSPLTTTLGAGGGTINTQATDPFTHVERAEGVNIIINSPVTGPGSLTKLGLGALTLTNETSDYTGGTNLGAFVNGGPETINGGVLIAAKPNVLGQGPVHLIHGTLATQSFVPNGFSGSNGPTGVASVINIHGNLTTEVNSTLALGIGGELGLEYDHVNVDGNVTLKGGTLFVASLKKFQPVAGSSFAVIGHSNPNPTQTTVLTQPGFTELDDLSFNSNPNIHPLIIYLPNAVLLTYASLPTSGIKLATETEEREQQELRKLPSVKPPPGPSGPPPPDNKPPEPPSPLPPPETDPGGPSTPGEEQQEHQEERQAMQFVSKQLLPRLSLHEPVPPSFLVRLLDPTVEQLTSLFEIPFSNANIQRAILGDRMRQIQPSIVPPAPAAGPPSYTKEGKEVVGKEAPAPVYQPAPRWGIWANGWGLFGNVNDAGIARGYRFTTGGMSAGIDYRLIDSPTIGLLAVGLFGGYSHTWTDLRPGSIDVDSGRGGAYAIYSHPTGWWVDTGVWGGYNSWDTNRQGLLGRATSSSDGYEFSTFGEAGWNGHFGNLTVGPLVAMQFTTAHINSFTEHGSLFPLDIHSDSEDSLITDVGAQAYYNWHVGKMVVIPGLRLAWEHEYKTGSIPLTVSAPALGGASAVFKGPRLGHDSLIIQAGVGIQCSSRMSITIGYDGQVARDNFDSHAVTGTFSFSF